LVFIAVLAAFAMMFYFFVNLYLNKIPITG